MNIIINGISKIFSNSKLNVNNLLAQLEIKIGRVAIEVNGTVINKDDFSNTYLKENDKIEIIHFLGGG